MGDLGKTTWSTQDVKCEVVRQPLKPLILDVVKNEITFTFTFDTFTYRRFLFDLGIKRKDTDEKFKVNEQRLKVFYESPILEEEIVKELSLGKATCSVIYPS